MTEADLRVALKVRFGPPDYAFIPHVSNATGGARRRTADALAMSLWPSRGLELHGFEIKTSRSDWLRELNNPAKADEIFSYCDRWWIAVAEAKMVKKTELPQGWGLLAMTSRGLRVAQAATKLQAQPMTRSFLAAILRRAAEHVVPQSDIAAQCDRSYKEGYAQAKKTLVNQGKTAGETKARLEAMLEQFHQITGLSLHTWTRENEMKKMGEAIQFAMNGGIARFQEEFKRMRERAAKLIEAIDQTADVDKPQRKG